MEQNPQNNLYQEESIDLKKYLFKFLANWYWFAIALGLTMSIAYMVNRYSEPTYTISSSVIVGDDEAEAGTVSALISELGMRRRVMRAEVVNEIAILKSYTMARKAIEELDFGISYVGVGRREIAEAKYYQNTPFTVLPDSGFVQRKGYRIDIKILDNRHYRLEINDNYGIKQQMKFGEPFTNEDFSFKIVLTDPEHFTYNPEASNKYYFFFNDINSLAKQYRGKLNVETNDERGSVLTLRISGFVPEKMAAYLNKLAEMYIRSDLEEKNRQAQNTLEFIDAQLKVIVDSLNKAEYQLQKFRSDHQIFDLGQKGSLLMQDLNQLQKRKMEIELNDRYYEYIEGYLASKSASDLIVNPTTLNISNPSLESLVQEYNEKLSMLNRYRQYASEETSSVRMLQQELELLKASLREQVSTGQNLNTINRQKLNQEIAQIENEINRLPQNERSLVNIEREYKLNNELYTFLLEKRAEAGITKASNVSKNKILDVAIPQNAQQQTPKRSQNYLIALVLGLGIPGGIILLFEFFNNKIEDKKDIERNTSIPIIGTIGHNEMHSDIPVYMDPKSSLAESFRTLRTNLQYILRGKERKVVMITSTISGEGKTFAAVNLAAILAMANKKVLLAGLDLRKPSLHRIFEIPNEVGISNYLIEQAEMEQIVKSTWIENLHLAPSGPVPPNPAELIETGRMEAFFEQAQKTFDYIIIDTPPVALVTDAILISRHAHANIFMIRQKYSSKHVFDLLNSMEVKQKMQHVNILVNDLRIPKYYGYSYGYAYGYGYGYGYGYKEKR
ncbi:MAG: polysaccharide biosynthesis tyrosine autokinase [Bacteroidales bacterium]|jgi:capsular exopolysaccharide synthesis family protein|nr:polysaccharide biosynthesis tyrosine autokinase [Bacteroidales bacterium]